MSYRLMTMWQKTDMVHVLYCFHRHSCLFYWSRRWRHIYRAIVTTNFALHFVGAVLYMRKTKKKMVHVLLTLCKVVTHLLHYRVATIVALQLVHTADVISPHERDAKTKDTVYVLYCMHRRSRLCYWSRRWRRSYYCITFCWRRIIHVTNEEGDGTVYCTVVVVLLYYHVATIVALHLVHTADVILAHDQATKRRIRYMYCTACTIIHVFVIEVDGAVTIELNFVGAVSSTRQTKKETVYVLHSRPCTTWRHSYCTIVSQPLLHFI
jgi:hypothetical protein